MGDQEPDTFVVDVHFDHSRGGEYALNRSIHTYHVPLVSFSHTVNNNRVEDCILAGVMVKCSKFPITPNVPEYIQSCCKEFLLQKAIQNVEVSQIAKWEEIVITLAADSTMTWVNVKDGQIKADFWTIHPKGDLTTVLNIISCLHARLGALEKTNVLIFNRQSDSPNEETGKFGIIPSESTRPFSAPNRTVAKNPFTQKPAQFPRFHEHPLYNGSTSKVETTYESEKVKETIKNFYKDLSQEQLLQFLHKSGFTDAMESDKEAFDQWIAGDVQRKKLYDLYKSRIGTST